MTPLSSLVGARIRRIDAPEPELIALSFFARELRAVLLFSFTAAQRGVGIVMDRPHGKAASAFVLKLRKELEGGRIARFEQPDELTLLLVIERAQQQLQLICDFATPSVRLQRDEQTLITATFDSKRSGKRSAVCWPESIEELSELGPRLLLNQAATSLTTRRAQLERAVRSAEKRLQRRLLALEQDAARSAGVAPLRLRASLLLSQQHQVKRGQGSVQLVDYTVDPPAPIEIALDPARTLKEQIEAWFKQARRFERGAEVATERSRVTARELEQLAQLRERVAVAELDELVQLGQEARALGVRGAVQASETSAPRAQKPGARRKPYREFHGAKDRTILVGKGAADNDALTRLHARPQDLWLHARGVSGAHVVVPMERNEACPQELLLDAAHLAAHFSSARGEQHLEVSYTPKRYVRKPRGAAVGAVQLEREKVLTLQLEPNRLARLLSSERSD